MKDSKGRVYDGWCMKYPEKWGYGLVAHSFATTRTRLWDEWIGCYYEGSPANQIRRYRRLGFRAVKVRLLEVVE